MTRLKIAMVFALLSILSISVYAQAGPVPDTGQTQSYTDTFGEDSDYTINPQSYTKLDAQGNALPDSATSWVMVKDNVNGLIWEVKTDDGSIHDKDNTYNWQEAQDVFIAGLNIANFGGSSDWRLPTVKELPYIVNSGEKYSPAIDTTYFPNTVSYHYWSSTTHARYPDHAWFVYFGYGTVSNCYKSDSYYVRAVRGGQFGSLADLSPGRHIFMELAPSCGSCTTYQLLRDFKVLGQTVNILYQKTDESPFKSSYWFFDKICGADIIIDQDPFDEEIFIINRIQE